MTEYTRLDYSLAPRVSALDDRLPPTVVASTLAAEKAGMLETVCDVVDARALQSGWEVVLS